MTKLEELKNLFRPPPAKETWACELLPTGICKGAITEVTGVGKAEFVVQLLQEHPTLHIAWIEEELTAYPIAFLQRNIALHRILFVEAKKHVAWACLNILKAQAFPITIVRQPSFELETLRRFQLASEKSNASLLWLSPQPHRLWPIHQHIVIQKQATLRAKVMHH